MKSTSKYHFCNIHALFRDCVLRKSVTFTV